MKSKAAAQTYTQKKGKAMQQESKAKPVLFWDFHGTLSLPEVTWFEVALEAAAEEAPHQPLTTGMLDEHLALACLPWFEIEDRDASHLTDPKDWWAFCEEKFAQMLQKCGFAPQDAAHVAPVMHKKSLQAHRYHLYADAVPMLQTLQRRGYQSHILSNNFPELEALVTELGIRPYFETVLTSALIGYDKPRAEIFAVARRAAGPGREVWMIGDNPKDDIEGGNAAGFVTVAVHTAGNPQATHSVDDLAGILQLLP